MDADNEIPENYQIDAWKNGRETLYVARLILQGEVGAESHEMTEDEAKMFGMRYARNIIFLL